MKSKSCETGIDRPIKPFLQPSSILKTSHPVLYPTVMSMSSKALPRRLAIRPAIIRFGFLDFMFLQESDTTDLMNDIVVIGAEGHKV